MKKLLLSFFVMAGFVAMANINTAQAVTWYGFCYGKKAGETFCKGIEVKNLDFNSKCATWAQSYGANSWGNKSATTVEQLQAQQTQLCDKILDGGGLPAYACYIVTYCTSGGLPSSSIAPIGVDVYAGSSNEAIHKCGDAANVQYLQSLKNNSVDDCYTKIEATLK
ncbi:MAG: hypothetical protein HQK50_19230 [Oligoflexia bacterium]|nr:hypothetical protein [Oligoflexia bacterium]MBF0367711.1 hypothetical protein [Oligoflexia bacterium]